MRGPARRRVRADPSGQRPTHPVGALRLWIDVVRSYYLQPVAWVSLLVSAAFLTYGGGAVMFWVHAILRKEAGPAIADSHHWLLDSTLGFVALTPILAVILPLAVWHAGGRDQTRPRLWVYVIAVTTVFTLFTGPGPLLHNTIAGGGTPLANLATRVFGEDEQAAMHAMHEMPMAHSPVSEGLLQVAIGLPVYLVCTWLSLQLVRTCARLALRARRSQPMATQNRDGSAPMPPVPMGEPEPTGTPSALPCGDEHR